MKAESKYFKKNVEKATTILELMLIKKKDFTCSMLTASSNIEVEWRIECRLRSWSSVEYPLLGYSIELDNRGYE